MKIPYLLISGLLLFLSCNESIKKKEQTSVNETPIVAEEKDSFHIGEVIPSIASKINSANSFSLYLPHQYSEDQKLPALIFLDPHGDGSFPLYKYKSFAEKFGVTLIGSNDSKNGVTFDETNLIVQGLVAEVSERLNVDVKQISLAGFSGGAKVALVAASSQSSSLLSIIYCGAGLPQLPRQLPPALAIAGLKAMNYTEVIQADQQLENNHLRHALIEWNGKHEWSDSTTFENAFYWILFRAMENKIQPLDESMIQAFIRQNSKHDPDPLPEELRLKKLIGFLGGVVDISEYTSSLSSLTKQKKYFIAREKQQSDIELESRMKQNYLECINLKDPLWWRDEVNHLRSSKSNPMNDRILGYISLACYSYSNNALKQRELSSAEKYLAIYALADRENPDRAYMQACLYGLMQNKEGAIQSITEAINYGFKDRSKLISEPALAFISNTPEFNELIRKIK